MRSFKNIKIISLSLLLIIGMYSFTVKEDLFLVSKNIDIFTSLYKELNINYVDETNASKLMKVGIDAMLNSLDPYTEYVPESEIEDYKLKYISTQYSGIGASTLFKDGKLFVNEVIEGNPAQLGDLKPGDEIVKINETFVKSKDRNEISQLLRGPKASKVSLLVEREGKQSLKELTRAEIKQPNVTFSGMLDQGIGYIKLEKFLENSGQEVKDALLEINKNNPEGLILDLRNNGGGILQEAVKIVNLFVNKGQLVVSQKGRNTKKSVSYSTVQDAIAPNLPLVVLINGSSASASEIVAGSLQDLDRAIVVGQRSYGKGLVQQSISLPYNSMVKVTIAKYYTPSGRCIQKLDYGQKNNQGKAILYADSTFTNFKTKAGRNVYDNSGIYPDVAVDGKRYSLLTISLINSSMFFDYANTYKKNNPNISAAKNFKISDQDYLSFVNSIADKKFNYQSNSEKLLKELKRVVKNEKKSESIQQEIDHLTKKLESSKKSDLMNNKEEIKKILETQIVSRYYYDKGKIEQSFQYDDQIEEAKKLFNNQPQMLAILKGEGNYSYIGKPTSVD